MPVRRTTLASCTLLIAASALLGLTSPAHAYLPDHRAYEQVSPVEKGGQVFGPDLSLADASGEHVILDGGVANSLLSSGMSWMLETRTPTGWSGTQIGPPPGPEATYQEQRSTAIGSELRRLRP